jgi:excisionase family DNA binding protein
MPATEQLIGTAEAATILHIHVKTCTRLAREGKIPAMRAGGVWRYSPTALTRPALALPTPREPRPVSVDQQLAAPALIAPPREVSDEARTSSPRVVPSAESASRCRTRGRHTVQLEL